MHRGCYDPHSSDAVREAASPYMREKMRHANMYCRRQRAGKDVSSAQESKHRRDAEALWNSTYRGGREKKRKVDADARDDLAAYMKARPTGVLSWECFCLIRLIEATDGALSSQTQSHAILQR